MRGIGRYTQECIPCTAQAEREINISTAPPLKCFIKFSMLEKYCTPHKKCKPLKERTRRSFLVMFTHPRFRICTPCDDALGIDILPRKNCVISIGSNSGDVLIKEEYALHRPQTFGRKDHALLQEEQQIARRRLCAAIVPCGRMFLRHRENTAGQIMELRPHGIRRSLRNGDDQLRRKICRRRRRKGGLCRLSQIFPRLRQRKNNAERAHDFSVRRSMKSVCPIFAAT